MSRLGCIGLFAFISGCAATHPGATSVGADDARVTPPAAAQPQASSPPNLPPPSTSPVPNPPAAVATPSPTPTPSAVGAAKPAPVMRPVKPTVTPPRSAAAQATPAKPPPSLPVAPTTPAPARAAAPAVAAAPTLNLTDLEQRLRNTRAIGVFTKLSLKNQVDDLLAAFRTVYQGANKRPPPELRQRYDQLLLKVLSALQDGDPPLAAAIASSREAIWGILADPDKFAQI